MAPKAFIAGCSGPELSADERAFFREADPWGLILFARNCVDADQIRALVADYRDTVGRVDAPVLIDQEGGRVQRLKPPQWPVYPPAAAIGTLYGRDRDDGTRAAWLLGRLIGEDLFALDITVDCVPCIDIRIPGAHDIIGDRSFGTDPAVVAHLAGAVTCGLAAAGVAPVMKHIPGHGRALADSHFELPSVGTEREELERLDFEPFRRLAALPMAMTAHVIYSAVDAELPATLSATVVDDIIRRSIGFDGLLMTDDLSMNALSGSLESRTGASMAAGCDMALHCNGDLAEMTAVASEVRELSGRPAERAAAALDWAVREETDIVAARREFEALIDAAAPAGEA